MFPFLLLLSCAAAQSGNTIDTWVDALSTQLAALRSDVMRVDDVLSLFNGTAYDAADLAADQLADQLEAKLSGVFGSKEKIVRSLAAALEDAWRGAKGGAEAKSCQWNNAAGSLTGLTRNELYFDDVSHDFSAVKVAPGAKVSDADICVTEVLDSVFKNNDPERNLPWQYVGLNSGYHRQYPASRRTSDYDPRSRPWYTGASSGPKDVVLILDVSGSMADNDRISLMKDAAKTVLASLTINDYVNVVTFSTAASTFRCASDTMLPADAGTIAYLQTEIQALRASGSTDFYKAFQLAFDVIDRTKRAGAGSGCASNRVILFLTDGEPSNSEDHMALIAERNRDAGVAIFTYALGSNAKTQRDIACRNKGAYTFIEDGGNLRTKMQSYYQVFGATAAANIFWTAPYLDASGLGMMVTAALPTYDSSSQQGEFPSLIGVVGHDILLSDFTVLVSTFASGRSYAFLVDRAGNAISHPRMSTNTNPNEAPIYQDFSVLENNNSTDFYTNVRTPLLSGKSGKHKMVITRVLTRGDSGDGVTFERVGVTYVWRPVGPFIACYVLADDDVKGLTPLDDGQPANVSFYDNLERYPRTGPTAPVVRSYPASHPKYPNQVLLPNATTFYLAPRAYVNAASRARITDDTPDDVAVLHAVVNDDSKTDESGGLRPGIRATVRRLSLLDSLWLGTELRSAAMGWIYLGTESGVHRRYPGGLQGSRQYDPTQRPWYLRAKALPNALVVSAPYTDASGLGRVITLANSVPRRAGDSGIGGVIGLDFQYPAFESLVHSNTSACVGNARSACFAIESSGLLVTSDQPRHAVRTAPDSVFIGAVEPGVAQALVAAGFLQAQSYVDFREQRQCVSYKTNNAALDAVRDFNLTACGLGQVRVRAVTVRGSVTNMYLIQTLDVRQSSNGCKPLTRGCVPLAKPSPCAPMELSALARVKAPCPETQITEAFLEHVRKLDPDGGSCTGLTSGEIAGVVIGVIVGVLLLACCGYFAWKRYND